MFPPIDPCGGWELRMSEIYSRIFMGWYDVRSKLKAYADEVEYRAPTSESNTHWLQYRFRTRAGGIDYVEQRIGEWLFPTADEQIEVALQYSRPLHIHNGGLEKVSPPSVGGERAGPLAPLEVLVDIQLWTTDTLDIQRFFGKFQQFEPWQTLDGVPVLTLRFGSRSQGA